MTLSNTTAIRPPPAAVESAHQKVRDNPSDLAKSQRIHDTRPVQPAATAPRREPPKPPFARPAEREDPKPRTYARPEPAPPPRAHEKPSRADDPPEKKVPLAHAHRAYRGHAAKGSRLSAKA